jgi:hypothetical protein
VLHHHQEYKDLLQASILGQLDLVVASTAHIVSPTVKGLTITPTDWQNLYFKLHITIIGLSSITLQI